MVPLIIITTYSTAVNQLNSNLVMRLPYFHPPTNQLKVNNMFGRTINYDSSLNILTLISTNYHIWCAIRRNCDV